MARYTDRSGNPVPSVTEVISAHMGSEGLMGWAKYLADTGMDYKVARDYAAGIGTVTHELVAARLEDRRPELPEPTCFGSAFRKGSRGGSAPDNWTDDRHSIALQIAGKSARKIFAWMDSCAWPLDKDSTIVEQPIVSETMGYAGTPDLVWDTPEGWIVVDWKTSRSVKENHKIQLGAYAALIAERYGAWPSGGIVVAAPTGLDHANPYDEPRETELQVESLSAVEIGAYGAAFGHLLQAHRILDGLRA